MLSLKRLLTSLTGNAPTITGLVVGQERDFIGFPRSINDQQLCRHLLASGDSEQSSRLLFQLQLAHLERGGAGVFIDRHDEDGRHRDQLLAVAQRVGRGDTFVQLDMMTPERSATYSPLYAGPAEAVAARLLRLLPPPAISYPGRASTLARLSAIIDRLRTPPMKATLAELVSLLLEQRKLRAALAPAADRQEDRTDQQVLLDLDQLAPLLAQLRDSVLGTIVAPARHGIDLLQIHQRGGFCHVRVGDRPASRQLLDLVLAEMRQALRQRLLAPPVDELPFLWALDGMEQDIEALDVSCFQQARTARLGILGAVPSLFMLQDEVGSGAAEVVLSNTRLHAVFPHDIREAARRVGAVPVAAILRDLAGCPRHWFTLFDEVSGACLPLKLPR